MGELYVHNKQGIYLDLGNRFVYEVLLYLKFENTFSLVNSKLFSCNKEIPNIIETYTMNKYIDMCCYLYAAPKKWLIDNEFIPYIENKLKNLENDKQKKVSSKSRSRRTTSKTSSS